MLTQDSSSINPLKFSINCIGAFIVGTLIVATATSIYKLDFTVKDLIYNSLMALVLFLAIQHKPKTPTSVMLIITAAAELSSLFIYFIYNNYYVYYYRLHLFYTLVALIPVVILYEIGLVRKRQIIWIAVGLLCMKIIADLTLEFLITLDQCSSIIELLINLENYLCIILMGVIGVGFCLVSGYWIWLKRPSYLPSRFIKLILLGCSMFSLMMMMKGYFATYRYWDAISNQITSSFSFLPAMVWITAFLVSHRQYPNLDRHLMIAAQITLHVLFFYVLFGYIRGTGDSMKFLLAFSIYLTFQVFLLLAVLIHQIHESSLQKSRELLNLNDRLFGIMKSVHDAVFVVDSKGLIQDMNIQAERLTGLNRDEVLASSFAGMIHPYDSGEGANQFAVTRKDNHQTIVEMRDVDVEMGGERFRVSAMRDLTLLKLEQEQKMRLQEQLILNEKREMISRLISGMGHDFNNYLSSIVGYTHLLMTHLSENEKLLKYARAIGMSAEHATKTIHRILSATTQNRQFEVSDVDVNRSLEDLSQLLTGLNTSSIHIDLQLAHDLPTIQMDPFELIRCLLNLARNGIKSMEKGGSLTLRSSLASYQAVKEMHFNLEGTPIRDYVMVEIADTGCGIPDSIRQRVFDPYFSTRSATGGVGLGLSIVLNIVRSNEGLIDFQSELGKGTTFRVLFPVRHEELVKDSKEAYLVLPGSPRILIMMHKDALQTLVQQSLESIGYCYESIDPEDFDQKHKELPDFVLLVEPIQLLKAGIQLPDLMRHYPTCRVICFGPEPVQSPFPSNRVRFISKPIQVDEFLAVLRSMIVSISERTTL